MENQEQFHEDLETLELSMEDANESLDRVSFQAYKCLQAAKAADDGDYALLCEELIRTVEEAKVPGDKIQSILSAYSALEAYCSPSPDGPDGGGDPATAAAEDSKRVKWAGTIKLAQTESGKSHDLFLDDVYVGAMKEGTPALTALAKELNIDLEDDAQEVSRKWAGQIEFRQTGNSPLFEMYLGDIPVTRLTSNSPQGKDLEELLLINLVDSVGPEYKKSQEDWRAPSEKREADRLAKKTQVASASGEDFRAFLDKMRSGEHVEMTDQELDSFDSWLEESGFDAESMKLASLPGKIKDWDVFLKNFGKAAAEPYSSDDLDFTPAEYKEMKKELATVMDVSELSDDADILEAWETHFGPDARSKKV